MAAAKFVALVSLLQLTAAWHLPALAENYTFDNETANCSSSSYEEWLDLQPQPVLVDAFANGSGHEEAEEVVNYVEPVVEVDHDVDPEDSETTDEDGDHEDGVEEVDDEDEDLQDFIVDDDAPIERYERDVGEDVVEPVQGADQVEDSDEHDVIKDSSEENGDGSMSSEEESNEEESSEENKGNTEEVSDEPYAFLRVKQERSSQELIAPQERVKVMLKNFQNERMNFFVTASPFTEESMNSTGAFSSQPVLVKLRGCWLQHKQNAHNVCKHHHGRRGHGRARRHHHHRDAHHHHTEEHNHTHTHSHDEDDNEHYPHAEHDHEHYPHAQDDHEHYPHAQDDHEHYPHAQDDQEHNPHAEINEAVNEIIDEVVNELVAESEQEEEENSTASNCQHHHGVRVAAEGDVSLCSPSQLEGWLGPESKVVVAFTAPDSGCVVFRAYVSYPLDNGSLVLTSDGNQEYLESLICVQPNPIPEEDEYDEHDVERNDFVDYSDDEEINTINVDEEVDEEDEEDDEEDSFTPRRGRAGYNLRARPTIHREPDSSEQVIDDDETDEDYVPDFLQEERNKRSPDQMSPRQLKRLQWRQRRQARKEERRLNRGRHNRRNAGDEPASNMAEGGTGPASNMAEGGTGPASNMAEGGTGPASNMVEGGTGPAITRQQRRQMKKQQRRLQRQERRQERQGSTAAGSSAEAAEGRRGRGGGRRNRPNRRNRPTMGGNRRLHSSMTDMGAKFCCKQGIQHKKASTYTNEDGITPEVNCSAVPDEVPSWAAHKHPITKEVCEGHYVSCCNQFDLTVWQTFQDRRAARRAQRANRTQQ